MQWTELFIDKKCIIEASDNLAIKVHHPKLESTIFTPKDLWDKHNFTTYFNMVEFKNKLIMFYRGNLNTHNTSYHHENTCILISEDGGISWMKPKLKLFNDETVSQPTPKAKKRNKPPPSDIKSNNYNNNVICRGDGISHNFFAFNSQQDPDSLKAIGSLCAGSCSCCAKGVHLLESQDGINWKTGPVIFSNNTSIKQGYGTCFDSMNVVCWDNYRQLYRAFLRFNCRRGVRCIQTVTSPDLIKWSKSSLLHYKGKTSRLYYLSGIVAHPNNGYFYGFPSGQTGDRRETQAIDFMVSRDGIHWDVICEKWLGENSVSPERLVPKIIVSPDGKQNFFFVNDAKNTKVNRFSIRRDGFTSISTTDGRDSKFFTTPIWITSPILILNYVIKGFMRVEIYFTSSDSHNPDILSGPGKILLEVNGNDDEIFKNVNVPAEFLNRYVNLKFTIRCGEIFTYGFETERDKVVDHEFDISDYNNINSYNEVPTSIKKKKKKQQPQSPKVSKDPDQTLETKDPHTLETKDPQTLENINASLAGRPTEKIKYLYTDLSISDPKPEERIYSFSRAIKKIISQKYSNYNPVERGPKTSGRRFEFTTLNVDDKEETIILINNSRANCTVTFIS